MKLLSILFWLPSVCIRFIFVLIGLLAVPLTSSTHPIWGNNEHPEPPAWFRPEWREWLRRYWWRAVRNPANNLRYLFNEPDFEYLYGDFDPDEEVRFGGEDSSWRFIGSGIYSEFWYLRRVGDKYFEFRVGWKFSGVPGFIPTIQLRLGG